MLFRSFVCTYDVGEGGIGYEVTGGDVDDHLVVFACLDKNLCTVVCVFAVGGTLIGPVLDPFFDVGVVGYENRANGSAAAD